MALFHCMVRYDSARLGTVWLSSGRFAFPLQFSTAIEWAGLFTRRYNCVASTAIYNVSLVFFYLCDGFYNRGINHLSFSRGSLGAHTIIHI